MRNVVGNWVEGPDFFDRVQELAAIQAEAMRHDLLVLAPRRVGKTSLLHRVATEVERTEGMHAVYADVQARGTSAISWGRSPRRSTRTRAGRGEAGQAGASSGCSRARRR